MRVRLEYTHDELAAMRRELEAQITRTEEEYPGLRPLPPMSEEEAKGMLLALLGTAETRVLTEEESVMGGQLLAAYRMAIEARMLGRDPEGRYFVISEANIARIVKGMTAGES